MLMPQRCAMVSKPLGWPGRLPGLFCVVGFANVAEEQLRAVFEYQLSADYWSSFLTGQGKAGSYVTRLEGGKRSELERHVKAACLCGMADGPRAFATSFWAVRGEVPTQQ